MKGNVDWGVDCAGLHAIYVVYPYTDVKMIDLHSYTHRSTQVAEGAGISPATLRGYYTSRGGEKPKFRALGDAARELADKGGQSHLYNLRGAMHVALAVELIRNGLDAAGAFNAALPILSGDESRQPGGCLHPNEAGITVFLYARDCDGKPFTWIGGEDTNEYRGARRILAGATSFLTINVNAIEARMYDALDIEGHSWDA